MAEFWQQNSSPAAAALLPSAPTGAHTGFVLKATGTLGILGYLGLGIQREKAYVQMESTACRVVLFPS